MFGLLYKTASYARTSLGIHLFSLREEGKNASPLLRRKHSKQNLPW